MSWCDVKKEWEQLGIKIIRPTVVGAGILWLVLQIAGNTTTGWLQVFLIAASGIPAVVFGQKLTGVK